MKIFAFFFNQAFTMFLCQSILVTICLTTHIPLPCQETSEHTFHFHALEKEMATHSSVLAWRIPGRGSLVGCCLWGHTESDTTEVT